MKAIEVKGYAVSTTAVLITGSEFDFDAENLNTAIRAVITSSANNAMCTWVKGATPTATLGHPVVANGEPLVIESKTSLNSIKLIRQGSSDAQVTITLER